MIEDFLNQYIQNRFKIPKEDYLIIKEFIVESDIEYIISSQRKSKCRFELSKQLQYIITELYNSIYEAQKFELLKYLHSSGFISSQFEFLGELYKHMLVGEAYHLLPLPIFRSKRLSFQNIYEVHFQDMMTYKIFCKLIQENGVVMLNNSIIMIYFLGSIDNNFILKNKTSKSLMRKLYEYSDALDVGSLVTLQKKISKNKMYKLLENVKTSVNIKQLFSELNTTLLYIDGVSRKFNSFDELIKVTKEVIYFTALRNDKSKMELNQSLAQIDRKKFFNYTISVPKIGADLQDTSNKLHHCVKNYIKDVNAKKCQIFNLFEGERLKYTVELIKNDNGIYVNQVKGKYNDRTLENDQGFMLNMNQYVNHFLEI